MFIAFISEPKSICVSWGREKRCLVLMVLTSPDGSIPATAEAYPNTDAGTPWRQVKRAGGGSKPSRRRAGTLMLHGKNPKAEKMYYSIMNS